jgi:CheY-like chemotaxis protein
MATKTILIVDDDLPFAETLDDLLMGVGYRTVVAKNGQEAGVELEINPPDLILADLFMPVSNGFAFCRTTTDCSSGNHHSTPKQTGALRRYKVAIASGQQMSAHAAVRADAPKPMAATTVGLAPTLWLLRPKRYSRHAASPSSSTRYQ